MKFKMQYFAMAFALVFFAACQGGAESETTTAEVETEVTETNEEQANTDLNANYTLDLANSVITWEGTKTFVGSAHTGTLNFATGEFAVTEGQLSNAEFVVDLLSIKNADMAGTDDAAKLEAHLSSPDFFDVAQFPTASFKLASVEANADPAFSHTATGTLTIKAVSKEVSFPLNIVSSETDFSANGKLTFDRTNYDVKFGSGSLFDLAKDHVISDQISLVFSVKGTATN